MKNSEAAHYALRFFRLKFRFLYRPLFMRDKRKTCTSAGADGEVPTSWRRTIKAWGIIALLHAQRRLLRQVKRLPSKKKRETSITRCRTTQGLNCLKRSLLSRPQHVRKLIKIAAKEEKYLIYESFTR